MAQTDNLREIKEEPSKTTVAPGPKQKKTAAEQDNGEEPNPNEGDDEAQTENEPREVMETSESVEVKEAKRHKNRRPYSPPRNQRQMKSKQL